MAVDFLTAEQKAQYGQFACNPDEIQLARYFHLDEADLTFILNRRGDQNKFGFALQLTAVRFLGCFLSDLTLVPANVQAFVAGKLSIRDDESIKKRIMACSMIWPEVLSIPAGLNSIGMIC